MITKENLEIYTKANILREYDLSVRLREEHDLKAEFNKDGIRIKASKEQIWQYWKKRLESTKLKEVIINE